MKNKKGYSLNQFLFDSAFLLGFSGAFQGIITPAFVNINNLTGVICIQLQHSLIMLNLIWLMFAYDYRLKFKGVYLTYLLINLIAPHRYKGVQIRTQLDYNEDLEFIARYFKN